jgi:hypothetical protein
VYGRSSALFFKKEDGSLTEIKWRGFDNRKPDVVQRYFKTIQNGKGKGKGNKCSKGDD